MGLRTVQFLLVLLVAAACSRPAASPAGAPAAQATPPRKAITIALQGEVNALTGGMNQVGIISTPSRYFHEFVSAYLTFRDRSDEARPWIAADLPSVDAGT